MQPDSEELRRYYAALSDDALLELERGDLTEIAQSCYDSELAKRRLDGGPEVPDIRHDDPYDEAAAVDGDHEAGPDWLEDAACACSFESSPGNDAPDLDEARGILEAAGIPCHAVSRDLDPKGSRHQYSYNLMVPAALNLQAVSILDKDFFNPRLEAEWRTHFEALSEEELRALHLEDLTAGMLDRVERLTSAYNDELARRRD